MPCVWERHAKYTNYSLDELFIKNKDAIAKVLSGKLDAPLLEAFYNWFTNGKAIYVITKGLSEALSKCSSEIPISCFHTSPDRADVFCVEFGIKLPFIFDLLESAYVRSVTIVATNNVFAFYLMLESANELKLCSVRLWGDLEKIKKEDKLDIESCFDIQNRFPEEKAAQFRKIAILAFNAYLYIKTGQPHIERSEDIYKDKTRKERDRLQTEIGFNSHLPYTVVGYGWMKPKEYHVDGTTVRGHFRWQPWGEARTKVKLIWIDEHERQFK